MANSSSGRPRNTASDRAVVPAEVVWLTWACIDARLASRCRLAHVDGVGDLVARAVHRRQVGRSEVGRQLQAERRHDLGGQPEQRAVDRRLQHDRRPGQGAARPAHLVDPDVVGVAVPTVRVVRRQDVGLLLAQDRRQPRRRLLDGTVDERARAADHGVRAGVAVAQDLDAATPSAAAAVELGPTEPPRRLPGRSARSASPARPRGDDERRHDPRRRPPWPSCPPSTSPRRPGGRGSRPACADSARDAGGVWPPGSSPRAHRYARLSGHARRVLRRPLRSGQRLLRPPGRRHRDAGPRPRQRLAGRHHDVVVTPTAGPSEVDGIRVHRLDVPLLPFNIPFTPKSFRMTGRSCGREQRRRRPLPRRDRLAAVVRRRTARRRAGMPTVITTHCMWSYVTPIFGALDRLGHWSRWEAVFSAVSAVAAEPIERIAGEGGTSWCCPTASTRADWVVEHVDRDPHDVRWCPSCAWRRASARCTCCG